MVRLHVMGVCGTFMAGLAVIAKQLGYEVIGYDTACLPPMSDQLTKFGIPVNIGYTSLNNLTSNDKIIVGNVISRGNPMMEAILTAGVPYISGPEWISQNVLSQKMVIAVSGTHGKTSTTTMLAWILDYAGMQPGYLIGGIPLNFTESARHAEGAYFVIEADEYDTAFFDKRAKFMHYRPNVLIINNLEYDHADIYPDLAAISRQFQHLLVTMSSNASVIYPQSNENIANILSKTCWSQKVPLGSGTGDGWYIYENKEDWSEFSIYHQYEAIGTINWQIIGQHNAMNALSAIVAAHRVGVPAATAIEALSYYKGVKRRLELKVELPGDVRIYDDFAHHPTAISATITSLRNHLQQHRIVLVIHATNYTMRNGVMFNELIAALANADQVYMVVPEGVNFPLLRLQQNLGEKLSIHEDLELLRFALAAETQLQDCIISCSSASFGDDWHNELASTIMASVRIG